MEENELEEGEAYSGQEDDIDPDALSYIDEKIQDVLGHFQKEFEGGVSAEALGAKFGGYGSFLPSYQRSPSNLSQAKSPAKVPSNNLSRLPRSLPSEVGCHNISGPATAAKSAAPAGLPAEELGKKGTCISENITQLESVPQSVNNQNSLKVRIKVGHDNILFRNKPDIYSDLGLDISPSPSPGDSPSANKELSPEFPDALCESPNAILQIMTCFSVPGGYLLSPLSEGLLYLTEQERNVLENLKGVMEQRVMPEIFVTSLEGSLDLKDDIGFTRKRSKSKEKSGRLMEANGTYGIDLKTSLKKEIRSKTHVSQKVVSSAQDMQLSSGGVWCPEAKGDVDIFDDSVKENNNFADISKEPHNIFLNGRVDVRDTLRDNQEELIGSSRTEGTGNLKKKTGHSEGKKNLKPGLKNRAFEEAFVANQDSSVHIYKDNKSRPKQKRDKIKADFDKNNVKKDSSATLENVLTEKPVQEISSGGKSFIMTVKDKCLAKGGEGIAKESQNSGACTETIKENPSLISCMTSKENKKISHLKDARLESKSKVTKSLKESKKRQAMGSHKEVVVRAETQHLEDQTHMPDSSWSTEKLKMRSGFSNFDNLQIAGNGMDAPTSVNGIAPTSDATATTPSTVLIEENWVCCDKCQRWRLLPYGTDTANLPKKWLCSMQVWLPGLNKCNISEDETTKAFHELYPAPAPVSDTNFAAHHAIASSITSTETLNLSGRLDNDSSMPLAAKKKHGLMEKHGLMDQARLANESSLIHLSSSSKNLQSSSVNKSLNGVLTTDTDSLVTPRLGWTSRSTDFTSEKRIKQVKEKHSILSPSEDGGDLTQRRGKRLKPMIKREIDVDGDRTSKKIKKDGINHSAKDFRFDVDTAGKMAINGDSNSLEKAPGDILQSYSNHSSLKTLNSKSISVKKLREQAKLFSDGKCEEDCNSSEDEIPCKYDSNDKKRKLKEWQKNQVYLESLMCNQQVKGKMPTITDVLSERDLGRQTMENAAKYDKKDSSAVIVDGKMEMKSHSVRNMLSSNRKHFPDENSNGGICPAIDEPVMVYQGIAPSDQRMDCMGVTKRDVAYVHPPAATTSSSSKVSGSQKSKANLQEARGSPVESVSSSPMRILISEVDSGKRSSSRKVDVGPLGKGSPKMFSDGEVDGGTEQAGVKAKDRTFNARTDSSEVYNAADSRVLDSLKGSNGYQDREISCTNGVRDSGQTNAKRGKNGDILSTDVGSTNVVCGDRNVSDEPNKNASEWSNKNQTGDQEKVKEFGLQKPDSISYFRGKQRNAEVNSDKGKFKVSDSYYSYYSMRAGKSCHNETDFDHLTPNKSFDLDSHLKQHNDNDSCDAVPGLCQSELKSQDCIQAALSYQKENPSSHPLNSEKLGQSGTDLGKGLQSSLPAKGKLEKKGWVSQTDPKFVRGSSSEQHPVDAVNGDASQSAQPSRNSDGHNGAYPSSLRLSTPSSLPVFSSPLKKDGNSSVNALLKEARNLKHTANRLKTVGLENESSGIFFESALKFLHVASLMEPFNAESVRQGELVPSMQMLQMYYETAKFCEFCAHEFERVKELAAASLAYKCAEVAFFKVAYYYHPSASKDRLELQVVLDTALTGESPSSSASDVDNLNNQGGIDRVTSAKIAGSPQIANNHVIAARNRPHIMRLLTYTNYLNCAFEATRKSHNVIANIDLRKNQADGVCSVRKVLDFNFHDVEGLLRLVRLAMNSIGL